MKRVAVFAFLLLGGCFPGQQRQFAQCSAGRTAINAATDPSIQRCMIDHGYRRDFKGPQCPPVAAPTRNALCYEPRSTAGSLLFKIEMLFRDH